MKLSLSRPDLAAYGVVALCVVLAGVLVALGRPLPELLQFVAVTALGAGAGVSAQNAAAPAPAPAAEPAPPAPMLAADPATGIIPRIATHAP